MFLSHSSYHGLPEKLESKSQNRLGNSHFNYKPNGLWVSVETDRLDDWRTWCRSEEFKDYSNGVVDRVWLRDDHQCLVLTEASQLDDFTEIYGTRWDNLIDVIDWPKVASHYQGLIIAPYQYSRRLASNMMWYYGWDCASGCIWDVEAIDRHERIDAATLPSTLAALQTREV